MDGHTDKETGLFISIEDCCDKIEKYVAQNLEGKVYGLSGFSMGSTIAVELMARNKISIEKVILDAAFCVKLGILTPIYTGIFCWALRKIQSGKTIPAIMIESVMGKGNRGIVEANFNGEVTFWYGSNEHCPKKTAELLKSICPKCK